MSSDVPAEARRAARRSRRGRFLDRGGFGGGVWGGATRWSVLGALAERAPGTVRFQRVAVRALSAGKGVSQRCMGLIHSCRTSARRRGPGLMEVRHA